MLPTTPPDARYEANIRIVFEGTLDAGSLDELRSRLYEHAHRFEAATQLECSDGVEILSLYDGAKYVELEPPRHARVTDVHERGYRAAVQQRRSLGRPLHGASGDLTGGAAA